jgi:hypothetical protein
VSRDKIYAIASHTLPHQFAVPYMKSHDSPAVCPWDLRYSEGNLTVLVVVAVGLLIAQSDARDSTPRYIVDIASYSNFGGLTLKSNIR